LEADFPYELRKEDFSINATMIKFLDETKHIDDYYRQMNVIDADDATKTLVVKFGGAWSGDFSIDIRHLSHDGGSSYGLIDTSGLVFKVGAWVESVEPQSGSRFGGTLVTINGQNFGNEITDNPVSISTGGGYETEWCFVQSSTPTQIKCRVTQTEQSMNKAGKILTFLKTSEEAPCDHESYANCDWLYKEPSAVLESRTLAFNTESLQWELTIVGNGFDGALGEDNLPELWIAGK